MEKGGGGGGRGDNGQLKIWDLNSNRKKRKEDKASDQHSVGYFIQNFEPKTAKGSQIAPMTSYTLLGPDGVKPSCSSSPPWAINLPNVRMLLCCSMLCLGLLLIIILFFSRDIDNDTQRWILKAPTPAITHHRPPFPPQFSGWDLLLDRSRPNCTRVLANDAAYIDELVRGGRITFADPRWLDMNCAEGILSRNKHMMPRKDQKDRAEGEGDDEDEDADTDYPLAQARIVYKDYVLIEKELASTYSPHNWYCYSIDQKADELFHWRMRQLAECVPNVLVTRQERAIDSAGHNINRAQLDCLRLLTVPERRWNYVALLQNHDVAIKTNREMVQIYKWMDGANDVEVREVPEGRVDLSLDWSFKSIGIFRNESRNMLDYQNGFAPNLAFSKGYSECSLSRKMAEFMLNELNLGETVRRLEEGEFGIDELLIPTLHAADALRSPGGFTRACMERGQRVEHITRMSIWSGSKEDGCGSQHSRHAICIFGMEDLGAHLARWPHLFANKLMPNFDFGALLCWWEEMHRRAHLLETRAQSMAHLDEQIYTQLPHVRFQKLLANLSRSAPDGSDNETKKRYKEAIKRFDCTINAHYVVKR